MLQDSHGMEMDVLVVETNVAQPRARECKRHAEMKTCFTVMLLLFVLLVSAVSYKSYARDNVK